MKEKIQNIINQTLSEEEKQLDWSEQMDLFTKRKKYFMIEEDEQIILFKRHPEFRNIYISPTARIIDTWRMFSPSTKASTLEPSQHANKVTGYVNVTFYDYYDKRSSVNKFVHQLVLETFINRPNETDDWVVDHRDENRQNNNLSNLNWLTRRRNLAKRKLGKETHIFDVINKEWMTFKSGVEACEKLNLSPSNLTIAIQRGYVLKERYLAAHIPGHIVKHTKRYIKNNLR